jgi:ABC-type nitrate/sulfonate/bicarbonate transport system permease component
MKKLRSLHLFLGCIFTPMLLFFAISGIWQTYSPSYAYHSKILGALSTIHKGGGMTKSGVYTGLSSPVLRYFILAMALGFIVTTILGVVMAVTQGGNRRAAFYCLAFGVVFPLAVIVISVYTR